MEIHKLINFDYVKGVLGERRTVEIMEDVLSKSKIREITIGELAEHLKQEIEKEEGQT